jgi:hypothetical protein
VLKLKAAGDIFAGCFFIDHLAISAILKSEIGNLKSLIRIAPIVQWPRISGSHPGDRGSTPLGGILLPAKRALSKFKAIKK